MIGKTQFLTGIESVFWFCGKKLPRVVDELRSNDPKDILTMWPKIEEALKDPRATSREGMLEIAGLTPNDFEESLEALAMRLPNLLRKFAQTLFQHPRNGTLHAILVSHEEVLNPFLRMVSCRDINLAKGEYFTVEMFPRVSVIPLIIRYDQMSYLVELSMSE